LKGLARELREEIGISVIGTPRPLIRVRHAYPSRDVLIDMWVVKRYDGEPQGLEGQALRWCTQDELATMELLPADKPIVAALRLPERLTNVSSPYYSIGDLNSLRPSPGGAEGSRETRLQGVFCASADEGLAAAGAGADFLVMREPLADAEVTALCDLVPVPVFARGIRLERAWELGASGIRGVP
jgi:hypothetical protein